MSTGIKNWRKTCRFPFIYQFSFLHAHVNTCISIIFCVAYMQSVLLHASVCIEFLLSIRFDIRLMKEGRMKGQAFVTFSNETSANKALKETNGFVLNSKPMAVVSKNAPS